MKEIFEAALGTFFLSILMVASLSCISASIDAKNADATKTAYIAEIENSNFSSNVIQAVFDQADADGYDVSMVLYHSPTSPNPAPTTATRASEVGNTSDVYMVRLELKFNYTFQFLDSVTQHTLLGYAR